MGSIGQKSAEQIAVRNKIGIANIGIYTIAKIFLLITYGAEKYRIRITMTNITTFLQSGFKNCLKFIFLIIIFYLRPF